MWRTAGDNKAVTALLEPTYAPERLAPVGSWIPARFTDTLTGTEEFTTQGDKLLALADRYWSSPEGPLDLDDWQRWLIRRILETYPDDWPVVELRGQLRYKRVVVSVGRQNGKSVVGALLILYYLTGHMRGAKVGSFASIKGQAKIVYNRLHWAIDRNATLKAGFRITMSRGIKRADATGEYHVYPAVEGSLQGEPFTAALYDELHLGNMGLWDAIVNGQRSKRSAQLVGLTTAGDDESLLLKVLYAQGQQALAGQDERFGFFVWEAEDDNLTEANMIAANPAIACGRISLTESMADARTMWASPADENGVTGRDRVIRYLLNRFVVGSSSSWIDAQSFAARARDLTEIDRTGTTTYGIDRTENWSDATISAARFDPDTDTLTTEVVATLANPTEARLVDAATTLANSGQSRFVVAYDTLKPLGRRLKELGYETWILGTSELDQAAAATKAAIQQQRLSHANDPIVRHQSPRAKPRYYADSGWRISRSDSLDDVDAVISMMCATYVAETAQERGMQLF